MKVSQIFMLHHLDTTSCLGQQVADCELRAYLANTTVVNLLTKQNNERKDAKTINRAEEKGTFG